MILLPPANNSEIKTNTVDDRLVVQADIFPTIADLCDVPIPESVEGMSMLGTNKRDYIYGELWEDPRATRMIRDKQYKLIYYPAGNIFQLFNLHKDPTENQDLFGDPKYSNIISRLSKIMINNLYGTDLKWVKNNKLVGMVDPDPNIAYANPGRSFGNQRGLRFSHSGKQLENPKNSSSFR